MRMRSAIVIWVLCTSAVYAQTALPDLGAGSYLGHTGGLYPSGSNQPPPAHAAAALLQSQGVVPRSASGAPDPNGLIGFVCLGMSNSSQEFEDLERAWDARTARRAHLVIANTCAGGQAAESMDQASDLYWTTLAPQRLAAAGIDPDQVQVAWMKQAFLQEPTTAFPAHATALGTPCARLCKWHEPLTQTFGYCTFPAVSMAGTPALRRAQSPLPSKQALASSG